MAFGSSGRLGMSRREEVLRRLVSPCEKDAIATHTNNQITKK
ncbi:hypothetical protein RTCIAT899_CH12430 [Rhizobium tropici CIAT 899]|nr:hypothetical protein RTCIAT899_CH12430 [Rhizobium tropici CIAT 899]